MIVLGILPVYQVSDYSDCTVGVVDRVLRRDSHDVGVVQVCRKRVTGNRQAEQAVQRKRLTLHAGDRVLHGYFPRRLEPRVEFCPAQVVSELVDELDDGCGCRGDPAVLGRLDVCREFEGRLVLEVECVVDGVVACCCFEDLRGIGVNVIEGACAVRDELGEVCCGEFFDECPGCEDVGVRVLEVVVHAEHCHPEPVLDDREELGGARRVWGVEDELEEDVLSAVVEGLRERVWKLLADGALDGAVGLEVVVVWGTEYLGNVRVEVPGTGLSRGGVRGRVDQVEASV